MDNWESGYICGGSRGLVCSSNSPRVIVWSSAERFIYSAVVSRARGCRFHGEVSGPQVLEGLPRPGGPSSFLSMSSDAGNGRQASSPPLRNEPLLYRRFDLESLDRLLDRGLPVMAFATGSLSSQQSASRRA